jgi:hypothetical protein
MRVYYFTTAFVLLEDKPTSKCEERKYIVKNEECFVIRYIPITM